MKQKLMVPALLLTGTTLLAADAPKANAPASPEKPDTLPPAKYVVDWYAPPTDWFPAKEIKDYTLNTRVPDLFWLKYDGAYTLALRIRPIQKTMLERQGAAKLVNTDGTGALEYRLDREKDAANRTIGVYKLDVPADDFIEVSFKAKNTALRNAGGTLALNVDGLATLLTSKDVDKSTRCADGFTAYKVAITPKAGARLRSVAFTVDSATAPDFQQEWVIFDFLLRRAAPKPRFTDIPRRRWIRTADFTNNPAALTASNGIEDVYTYIESAPADVKSIPLPLEWANRAPQATHFEAPEKYKPVRVKETINGKTYEGFRVTLTMGDGCYLDFPFKFDATVYNTISFLAKIDLPKDLKQVRNMDSGLKLHPAGLALLGDDYPRHYGTDRGKMNMHFDNFSFGLRSEKRDCDEWTRYGVCQGAVAQHWQRGSAAAPDGWKAVVFDALNDTCIGNKATYYADVSHWCFYYDTKKIPEGQTVTVTLLAPQASSGLMLAGGDMPGYKAFLDARDAWKPDYSDSRALLDPPAEGRMEKALPIVKNHVPVSEIVVAYGTPVKRHQRVVDRSFERLNHLFTQKYGMTTNIPVLAGPSAANNTKIFVGGDRYAKVNQKQYAEDMARLNGTDGYAVRTDGRNIYIYAAPFNFVADGRGLANGVYAWIMNNTDIVSVNIDVAEGQFIFDPAPDGNLSAVWGDAIKISPLVYRCGGGYHITDFMGCTRNSVWADPTLGGTRPRSTNHWWGYGTEKNMDGSKAGKDGADTWGIDFDGNRIRPGCYTGHPCLVNVLENAKSSYIDSAFSMTSGESGYGVGDTKWRQIPQANDCSFRMFDVFGLWVEDCQTHCQCEKCHTPIRLPNGDLIKRPASIHSMKEGDFLSTQFYANGCAMINQVNVYCRRDLRVESIAYMWMAEPPQFNISRNYNVRLCPYIRKDYMEPIFAPANDVWIRNINRWGQLDIHLAMYEYTLLFINSHPVADVLKLDLQAEIEHGRLEEMFFEGGSNFLPDCLERWVSIQLMWDPTQDVMKLRKQFIRGAFREAAPDMEKFFFKTFEACYRAGISNKIEFEMEGQVGRILKMLPATDGKGGTLLDECTRHLDNALRNVRNPGSKAILEKYRAGWTKYLAANK